MHKYLFLSILVALLLPANLRAEGWERDDAARAIADSRVPGEVQRLLDLSGETAPAALLRAVDEFAVDERLSVPARERVFMTFLLRLRELEENPARRAAVAYLRDYESRVLVPHPESRQLDEPLYRISAAALGTGRYWGRRTGAENMLSRIARDEPDALQLNNKDKDAQSARRWALENAPLDQLQSYGQRFAEKPRLDADSAPSAAVLARRLGRRDLFEAVFAGTDKLTALRLLPQTAPVLGSDEALTVLMGIRGNFELEAVAMLEAGRLGGDDARVRGWLLDALDQPEQGASAAVALARIGNPAVVAELARVLELGASERVQARVVLALTLIGSEVAIEVLGAYGAANYGPQHLKQEVARWLADR